MNPILKLALALAAITLPLSASAGSFKEASKHLDTDGDLVAFIDFEGDGREVGEKLNLIYQDVIANTAAIPPIPVDFIQLFDTLGFGSIRSMGLSSKELEPGLHINRTVTLLNGSPSGLFALYGDPATATTSFTAAEKAPADASFALTCSVNLVALRETVVAVLQQLMGPTGEGLAQQQLIQPLAGTEVTVNEIIEKLSGKWDVFWRQNYGPDLKAEFKIWAEIEDAGELLSRLQPLGDLLPIVFSEDDLGLKADFSALIKEAPMGLFLEAPKEGNSLIVYTHANWTAGSNGPRLVEAPEFQKLAGRLPKKALCYTYSAGFDFDSLFAALGQEPQAAPYLGALRKALDLLVGDFWKPSAAAASFNDNAMINEQYGSYSAKQALMAFPAAVGGGLTAAMAIPAFQKVRATSQEKTAMNNLRQIASAADQYFLETGKTEVRVGELVGPDKYIRSLVPVAGENYSDMVLTTETTEVSVTLPDGRVISIPF